MLKEIDIKQLPTKARPAKVAERRAVEIENSLDQISKWMDGLFRIPGVGWRFGLDALVGLIPGVGDTATTLVSFYILAAGVRYRVPKITLLRMAANLGTVNITDTSLNGNDASQNETTKYVEFDKGRWYHVRLRVTPHKIEGWIDDQQMVDVETSGKKISIRPTVEPSRPLGIASYATTAALKDIRLRVLGE